MRIAIVNIGSIVSGDLEQPLVAGDTIVTEDDRIVSVGTAAAQAGCGASATAEEYAPLIAAARAHGMITTVHTGGASIPGCGAITGDHLLALRPHVSFHVNAGPTAMPDRDFARIIVESDMALQ